MNEYYYVCSDCNSVFSKEEIEKEQFQYLCPNCGKLEKNMPLRGVLSVRYDYENLKNIYTREYFEKLQPGKFWDYAALFPIEVDNKLQVVGLNENQLVRLTLLQQQIFKYPYRNNEIFLMDETRNPTLSFKDRASSLVAVKALQNGIKTIAAASTGNAGSSMAGIGAKLGLEIIIYAPKKIPESKRIQIASFGAKLKIVNGDYDLAFDECLEDSFNQNLFNRNTAYNPLTIEGKKSAAFDIFISTRGNLPDNIFIPVGDGVIIAGIYKGFWDLKQLGLIEKIPHLIAVQAEGSPAVVDYIKTGKFEYHSASTIADSISAGAPRNLFMAAKSVINTNGIGIKVTDNEILTAQKEIAYKFGILSEPSSASVFAAFKKNYEDYAADKNLLLITGNGLKDIDAIKRWI